MLLKLVFIGIDPGIWSPNQCVNGNFRILKWRYCTIFLAIFCGDIPLHRPKKYTLYMESVPPINRILLHGHWLWFSYGFPMFSYGFPMFSYGFPMFLMVFPCFSMGFPCFSMVFLYFLMVFPWPLNVEQNNASMRSGARAPRSQATGRCIHSAFGFLFWNLRRKPWRLRVQNAWFMSNSPHFLFVCTYSSIYIYTFYRHACAYIFIWICVYRCTYVCLICIICTWCVYIYTYIN